MTVVQPSKGWDQSHHKNSSSVATVDVPSLLNEIEFPKIIFPSVETPG
jgi:hypothetical protein